MNLVVSINIDAPKEVVWKHITDIDNCPKMISGILDLKVLQRPETGHVGLKWQETREMFGKHAVETMWITESVENSYYKTRAENHGAIYVTTMSVESIEKGTKLSMDFSGSANSFFVKLITKVMGLMMKGTMIKLLNQDLSDIKTYVDGLD